MYLLCSKATNAGSLIKINSVAPLRSPPPGQPAKNCLLLGPFLFAVWQGSLLMKHPPANKIKIDPVVC